MWRFVFCVGSCHSEHIAVAIDFCSRAWKLNMKRHRAPPCTSIHHDHPPASVACIARCKQQLPLRFGVKAHQLRCFPCYRARIGPDTAIEKESGACFEQQRGVPETNRTSSCKNQRRHQVSCQIPETTQFAGFPPHQGLTARGDISTSVWFSLCVSLLRTSAQSASQTHLQHILCFVSFVID